MKPCHIPRLAMYAAQIAASLAVSAAINMLQTGAAILKGTV